MCVLFLISGEGGISVAFGVNMVIGLSYCFFTQIAQGAKIFRL